MVFAPPTADGLGNLYVPGTTTTYVSGTLMATETVYELPAGQAAPRPARDPPRLRDE